MSEERPGGAGRDEAIRRTPLWVKVFGGVALAVVLLFVILLLIGSGHGPGRHAASGSHIDAREPGVRHAPLDR